MSLELLGAGAVEAFGSAVRQPVIISILVFIGCALLWLVMLVSDKDSPDEAYVANRSLSPLVNGFAMAGEFITAVSLLAIPGAIALFGYDGFAAAVDALLGLGVAILLAQRIRNSGCYTLGDLFGLSARGSAPRAAAALVTLAITLPLLLIQLRAAGISTSLVIGATTEHVQVICTIMIGCLISCFAAVAELRGTTFMQIVKVPLALVTLTVITLLALGKFGWNPGDLLSAAVDASLAPDAYLSPGMWPYESDFGTLNDVGAHLVVILGTAMAPHLILRISASRSGRSARRSMSIAAVLSTAFVGLLVGSVTAWTLAAGETLIPRLMSSARVR
ncbi:sodium:solute symporter family transporter [Streptomyces arboris]|uniref:sodium:solute symporter family transporter n=1 Tax=Streptomyces arboris TaxID=2600619 RepID=UPI003640D5BC